VAACSEAQQVEFPARCGAFVISMASSSRGALWRVRHPRGQRIPRRVTLRG
jgi:hypothetical protein